MSRGDEFQERDIISLLIQYGGQSLPGLETTVAEYILADLEESLNSFDNPLYGKIAKTCHSILVEKQPLTQDYFLHHEVKEIRDLAVDILSESTQWNYSPNWEAKGLPLQNQPMPDQNFDRQTYRAINLFKIRKLGKMLEMNHVRIKQAEDSDDLETKKRYIQVDMKIRKTRNDIAKQWGIVILPW